MIRYIGLVIIAFMLMPFISIADENSAPNNKAGSVPVQSYESADSPPTAQAGPNNVAKTPSPVPVSTNASVSPDEAKPSTEAATNSAEPSGNAMMLSRQAAQLFQAELTQMNQNSLLFQQKVDEQLIELSNKNQLLQQQLRQLAQALTLLNEEMVKLQSRGVIMSQQVTQAQPLRQTASATVLEWVQIAEHYFGKTMVKAMGAGAVILLLLFIWAIWPTKKNKTGSKGPSDDTKDEYDYMGSPESIPAKLDLARTYIAMEDYRGARQALQEVFKYGDVQFKQQAQTLLDELPAES